MSEYKIQRIEIDGLYWADAHCPFCGQKVISINDGEFEFEECPHTLFHCSESGFGYRSRSFDENMGIADQEESEMPIGEYGFDGFTDQCTIANSIKFVSKDDPPSMDITCLGFAL